MQNKNQQQLIKKNKVSFNEREYKSNLNHLTAADIDLEMYEFFKELETTDDIANKKFSPKIFEVKKIFLADLFGLESIEDTGSELKSNLSKKKKLIAENNSLNNNINNNNKETENKEKSSFISNLLGGKKALVFANPGTNANPNDILAALKHNNANLSNFKINNKSRINSELIKLIQLTIIIIITITSIMNTLT